MSVLQILVLVGVIGGFVLLLVALRGSFRDDDAFYDLEILKLQTDAAILDLRQVRGWEKNPNFYREIISDGLYSLATLAFDTPERRMALAA